MWTAADIDIVLDEENCEGTVVTATLHTPEGDIELIGEIEQFDHELVLAGVHIQSASVKRNQLGWVRLRQVARAVAETADVDTIVVKGAVRTSGAGPGRIIPGPIRFSRAVRPDRRT